VNFEVSEVAVLNVLNAPDRVEESMDGRRNAYKVIDNRPLKVTHVDEAGDLVVVTVIEKESVGGQR
jgi:hypothetical protein